MEKKLVNSDDEVVSFLRNHDYFKYTATTEELEEVLGINFAMENGMYHEECSPEQLREFDGTVHPKMFRSNAVTSFPESYPAIMVYSFSEDFDRMGKVKTQFVYFVSLSDFG